MLEAISRPEVRGPADEDRRWDVLLIAATVLQAAVLTSGRRVVTVDGPAHLASAAALLHAGHLSQSLYTIDLTPVPNMLVTLLLVPLLAVLSADNAERVLVLGYALGLPLAMRWALRGLHPRAGWAAIAVVPFVGGYLYTYGFYNLLLGLVGFLVVAGLALRQRTGWTLGKTTALCLLLLLTWTAHLLPLLIAILFLAVLIGCRIACDRSRGWLPALLTHALRPGLAAVPVLVLTASFAVRSAARRGAGIRTSSVGGLLIGLLDLGRSLVAYTTWEYVGSVLVAIGILALALGTCRHRSSPERTAVALTGLLITAWYLGSPDRYGADYGFLNDRLSLFPPLLLILWSAVPPPSRRDRLAAVGLVLLGAVVLVGVRLPSQLRAQADVAEEMSIASQIPRGSTLVALRLWRDPPVGPDARNRSRDPLSHEAGRLAVLRDGVDVGHYEAVTPYFQVRFRPGTDPRRALDPNLLGLEMVPPRVDLLHGPQVVLVIGRRRADPAVLQAADTARLLQDLSSTYRLVATSRRSALVEVWQRR